MQSFSEFYNYFFFRRQFATLTSVPTIKLSDANKIGISSASQLKIHENRHKMATDANGSRCSSASQMLINMPGTSFICSTALMFKTMKCLFCQSWPFIDWQSSKGEAQSADTQEVDKSARRPSHAGKCIILLTINKLRLTLITQKTGQNSFEFCPANI